MIIHTFLFVRITWCDSSNDLISSNGATAELKLKVVATLVMISSYGTTGVINERIKIKTIVATPVMVQLK